MYTLHTVHCIILDLENMIVQQVHRLLTNIVQVQCITVIDWETINKQMCHANAASRTAALCKLHVCLPALERRDKSQSPKSMPELIAKRVNAEQCAEVTAIGSINVYCVDEPVVGLNKLKLELHHLHMSRISGTRLNHSALKLQVCNGI